MKKNIKYLYLAVMSLVIAAFASCSANSSSEDEYPNWQSKNVTYFEHLKDSVRSLGKNNTEWKIINMWSQNDSAVANSSDSVIIIHREETGKGTGCPLYTDSVRVHYWGWRLPSLSYPTGYVFDKSYSSYTYDESTSIPAKLAVSGTVDGFCTALQNMHIGDRWRVYVPYQMGYGTSGSGTYIPGYTTLVFDIKLVAYYRKGQTVPVWK